MEWQSTVRGWEAARARPRDSRNPPEDTAMAPGRRPRGMQRRDSS